MKVEAFASPVFAGTIYDPLTTIRRILLATWQQVTQLKNAISLATVLDHLVTIIAISKYILRQSLACRMFANALGITPIKEKGQKLDWLE